MASSARSMMKRNRADGSLPISSLMIAVGDDLIGDVDAQQPARPRVERGLPQHLRHHLAEPLESRDLRVRPAVAVLLQQPIAVRIVERPEGVLGDVDAVERRLRQEDAARRDQARHVPVHERQQQRRDVVAVGVGVGEDDDAAVAEPRQVEVLADAAAERGDQVRELLVLEDLRRRCALGVQHLAAQRQDRLARAIAALLRRSAGRIAFDDEELALVAVGGAAVAELAGERQPARGRALAHDLLLRGTARLARAGREDDARDDRLGDADVGVQPVLERRPHLRVDRRQDLGVVRGDPWSAPGTAAPARRR